MEQLLPIQVDDAQLLEARRWQINEIARVFSGVPIRAVTIDQIKSGEHEGGFLIPPPPETFTERLSRFFYARWLRAKWIWRRNVRPLA